MARSRPLQFVAVLLPGLILPGVPGTGVIGRFGASCGRTTPGETSPAVAPAPPSSSTANAVVVTEPAPVPSAALAVAPPDPRAMLKDYLAAHAPDGAELVDAVDGGGPIGLVHVARKGDSMTKIAQAYVDLTTAYTARELANGIAKANPKLDWGSVAEGSRVVIPRVVDSAPRSVDEARLAWPEDKSIRGLYANAMMAGSVDFPATLDTMAAHGLNAIVVDAKDVSGLFTYPSQIPMAVELKATKFATVPSFPRLVRVAHARGIRVIARVACFRDEYIAPKHPELAVQSKHGGPHRAPSKIVDWLDPANDDVQKYLLAVVQETLDAGADEVQLDYVRYPTEGIGDADFKLKSRGLTSTGVITDFVKRVHELTVAAKVPLSIDIFGVVAWRYQPDVEATGQDLTMLASVVEAISPMVYPSHFGEGFNGYEIPGDHPDVVAIGTKRAVDVVASVSAHSVVRPWIQAFPWKSPSFGSPYIAAQMKEAGKGGGVGWLAWNSGGEYGATFQASPLVKKK